MKSSKNELNPGTPPHTTHTVCNERLIEYGDMSIGCCCTGHKCTPSDANNDPLPPEGCTCGSLWTVRGAHGKPDCPYVSKQSPDPRTECDFVGYHLMNGGVCDRCGFKTQSDTTNPSHDVLREQVNSIIVLIGAGVLNQKYLLDKGDITREEYEHNIDDVLFVNRLDDIMSLIAAHEAAHTEEKVREARIDELDKVMSQTEPTIAQDNYYDLRIKDLTNKGKGDK